MNWIVHISEDYFVKLSENNIMGTAEFRKEVRSYKDKADESFLFDGIYNHIAEDSVSAARLVKKSLVQLGGTLGHFPEKYSRE